MCSIEYFFVERLSARLLILQSVFSVDGVWPQLPSCLEMKLKVWLVCKHPSHLEMQLKDHVYKKLCKLVYVCHSQRCSGTCGLIITTLKWQKNCYESREELGD